MIFLDTGFVFALFVEGDIHHERVHAVFEPYRDRLLRDVAITTNHVMAEAVTLLLRKGHKDPKVRHSLATRVGEQLFAGTLGRAHRASEEEEHAALAYLAKHDDQDYSFVDCLSFVVMEKLGIDVAWSVDRHFTHRFTALPGPLPKP